MSSWDDRARPMYIVVIDPGKACGIARLAIGPYVTGHAGVAVVDTAVWDTDELFDRLGGYPLADFVICEEFRLYPGKAAAQAWSPMETCETIGVIKYLAVQYGHNLVMQPARIMSVGRRLALENGVPMSDRRIKGKTVKDFATPKGPQHPRDALAHGYYWAWKDSRSPAYLGAKEAA